MKDVLFVLKYVKEAMGDKIHLLFKTVHIKHAINMGNNEIYHVQYILRHS